MQIQLEIYSYNPQLKSECLNSLLKNILDIEKRLNESINLINIELKSIEISLLENFSLNFSGGLKIFEDVFNRNIIKNELNKNENKNFDLDFEFYYNNNFYNLLLFDDLYFKCKDFLKNYEIFKDNFRNYLYENSKILSNKVTSFHKQCEILGNFIKEFIDR